MTESPEVRFLLNEVQLRLERPIVPAEISTLIALLDQTGLSCDVILMVVEYAVSKGKPQIRYIEKVALDWANEEIDDHQKAEEKIRQLNMTDYAWEQICLTFGIPKRKPTRTEETFANKYIHEHKFSAPLLKAVYDECINHTGKISYPYMSKILDTCVEKHIRNPKEFEALKEEFQAGKKSAAKGKKQDESKAAYDLDAFERSMYFDLSKEK